MSIFIDSAGRYYQDVRKRDHGDGEFSHPTPDMLRFIPQVPITRIEFEEILLNKHSHPALLEVPYPEANEIETKEGETK